METAMQDTGSNLPHFNGDVLTIGFATTVAMWGVGYFAHLPTEPVPSSIVFFMLIGCLLLGGVAAGRFTTRGWKGGLYAGLVTGMLNLLILGSVLGRAESGSIATAALLWVPGSIVLAMVCGGVGATAAAAFPRTPDSRPVNWPAAFTFVGGAATVLLLSVGGMVTGYEAGLAVPDWPNTEGTNMFLYPLAKMTGGIYFEHSHRLIGSLVGLTAVVLAIYLWRIESRRWLRWLAIIALAMVVAQGVMGGLRVTGRFTLSTAPEDMAPSILLAMIHGVFGQVFFATLAAIATFLSARWTDHTPPVVRSSATADRRLGIAVIAVLLVQLITGATLRHITGGVHLHVSMAVIVLALVAVFAVRSWGAYEYEPVLPKLGLLLLALGGLQLALGIVALVVLMFEAQGQASMTVQVVVTTLHQTVGALLLAGTTSLLLWHHRLVAPEPRRHATAPQATSANTEITDASLK